ncbi:MAG: S8 family serine peptidase [Verrucomicrobia bacterium]|nr:S8 family serine peptidase [Verrucomicrobiota bacterium]
MAWIESNMPSNERSGEFVVFESTPFVDGMTNSGDISANIQWVDLPGLGGSTNGTFDPIVHVEGLGGEGAPLAIGDGVFYDYNANGIFNYGATTRIPLYMVGLMNPLGLASAGVLHSGNFYGTMTRDGYISGFNQNQSVGANMPSMGLLTHEQGHDTPGWPDLYDYDVSTEEVDNRAASGDLYSDAGLVHGYPDLKFRSNPAGGAFPGTRGVTIQELNYTPSAILTRDAGPQTLLLYPVERYADQYYVFRDQTNPYEYFTINYNAGNLSNTDNPLGELPSPYASPFGRGVIIGHSDYTGSPFGAPQQQRSNNRFTWLFVQADGKYELEDGVNGSEPADAFGTLPETRQFSQSTIPRAEWYDKTDSGLRIVDIRIPSEPYGPCEIDIEWSSPLGGTNGGDSTDWFWVSSGNDSDGDGIPDAWEYYWFGTHANPLAVAGAGTDYDGDGLSDYGEWLAHANPTWVSSWSGDRNPQNLSDADIDLDGDGLSNRAEVDDWNTRPRDIDSDDDGITDGDELNWSILKADDQRFTSPTYSRSPLVERALQLSPTTAYLLPETSIGLQYEREPISDFTRLRLTNWTVEAWVYLDSASETGSIVRRETLQGATTFNLSVSNNVPLASISTVAGLTYSVLGLDTIPASTWTHIAGSLASDDNSLRIFVNGGLVGTAQVQGNDPGHPGYIGGSPSSGETWLGGDGLNGAVDELRIWSRARSQTEIDFGYEKIVNSPWHMFDTVAASTNDASGGTTNGTSVVTTNATTSSETYTGTAVVNDGSLVVNLRFDDAQNVTNRLDYGARAFGAEDYVHAGNWNYAVMGMATSQFITNHPTLSLSELIPEPMDDLNEDGIPDWWQAIYWSAFDPFTSGDWDADADPDEDGLINLYEYGSRTNPRNEDTDNNGTLDGDEDPDDDGLTTREELNEFGTDPFDDDTDDDTYKDGDEIDSSVMLPAVDGRRITSPLASRSPLSRKSLVLDGGAGHVVPGRTLADTTDRFDMDSWSIECWIMPTNGVQTGDLMIRTTSSGKTNFALRLTANVPTISFSTEGGKTYEAGGNGAIPVDEWTHLAGVWDPTVNSLALYVNGQSYQAQLVVGSCATGPGVTRIGVGIEGLMDEVRFWSVPRKPEEISAFMHSISAGAVASTVEEAPTGGPTAPSVGPFTIVENETSSALWTELLAGNAIPAGVTGLSATYNGSGGAAGLYAAFPSLPGSIQPFDGIILSSGQAVDGLGPNDSSSTSTSLGIPGSDEMEALVGSATQDAVWLELSFTTDASVDGLSFNILFGSEEFPEFVGSFNDAFAAFLDGENISFDANNEPVTVNNNYFQLNNSGDTTDPDTVGKTVVDADIEYDGLTPLLVTSKALSPGAHTLKLMVADAGDSAYDSAAFLSNFKFAQVGGEGTSVATAQDIGVSGALGSGSIDLAGQYMFDDGGDTAEDFSEPLNWDYAIEGVTFNTNQAALVLGLFDADGDRMPDWWEDMFFSAVVAAVSTNDSAGDATNGTDEATSESEEISGALADDDDDGDGLRNLYEYYCDTNPNADDSNNNGVGDGEEDYDNDGLSNGHEDDAGSDPRLLDTDDDGIIDVDDFGYGFDPANALIPIVDRVLDLDGLAGTHLRLAGGPRFGLSSWAVEAWVKPAGVIASEATILEREVQTGVENYFLGVNAAALPFVRFTAADDATVVTVTAAAEYALAAGEWVHLAGAFDEESGALTLHVNGALVDGIYTVKQPVTGGVGPAFVHAGEGFEGQIDELRIWTELPASVDLATVESGSLAPDAGPGDTNATVVSLQAGTYRISYVAGEWIDAQGNPQTSVAVGEAADLAAVLAEASASGVGSFEWGGGNVYVFIPVADASGNTGAGIEYLIETEVATASRTLDELKLTATASDSRLVAYYRFDDGTHTNGTSAKAEWTWGQAQEYARGVQGDWMNEWFNGATLVGGASMVDALADAPVRASLEDKDGDGIADWWEDLFFNGNADPGVDPDGDGLSNLGEFQAGSDPFAVDSNLDGLSDYDEDSDDDGLSNGDEEDIFGSDPGDPDTDDDGYDDGDEVMGWEPAAVDNYGTVAQVSSPVESISPHIRRSYVAAGRSMAAPHSERFAFRGVEEVILPGPTVEITAPEDGADIDVRFTDIAATITQVGPPIESVLLYINDQFMADYGAAESFNDTVIINSGENVVTVYGIDTDGNLGSDTITINGTFPPADIRVTQTWTPAGDMDTWLVDPQGRHMGWSTGGPGLPDNVDEQMPGAFLDIDDVSGTGPENITLEEPNSIAGEYEVWMNNYSNGGNPLSTVRVLVLEGRPGESYVEFGPQSVSASDGNGSDANAWWHVTTITMPEGTMDPPGSPILPPDNIAAPEVGATSENGWTMECWAKPGDSAQSGAIAAYRDAYGNEPFVIGLTNNMPFVRLRAASGTIYEAMGGAIDVDVWTHLAFVYSSTDHTLRLHINGLLAAAQIVLESRDESIGTLYVDTTLTGGAAPLSFTDIHLDELRIWKVARNGGLIAGQMHQIQKPTDTIVAMYRFDDGGTDIEDGRYPLNSLYDLGQGTIPDTAFNTKPGVDGDRYTVDDVAAGATPDGENDYVTSMEYAPVMGIIDGDDDGIANWYEDLFSTTNMLGGLVPGEDLDGDGLLNLFEYHARTNPDDDDSDGDGTIDPEEDDDGDDVANLDEQIHSTDPWLVDTDDDGYNDNVEIRYGSGATNALSPAFMRALHVDGSAASRVEMPPALRLALSDWTVSASVYLEMPVTAGSIIAREVQTGQYTYRLGIGADRVPYIAFTAGDGTTVQLTAPDLRALPLDEWIALEASYSTQTGDLRLLIEGEQVAHLLSETRPKTFGLGPVHGTIGDGINGYIDDVMILDGAGGTQLYYSFDDGTHADGVSGEVDFRRGQVQDLAPLPELANNWMLEWRDAGTLVGGATIELYPSMGSTDDTDGDGLPDAWEIANGLSPFETDTDGDGIADGSEDGDLDGLVNWTEYRAGTDPNDPDSDGDGTLDKDEDPDLDGLVNFDEQLNSSRPDLPDTDDDGLSDYDEVNGPIYTLPIASLSPAVARALELTSGTQTLELPDEARFRLANAWTIEAWVWLDTAFSGGNVLSRSVGASVNYQLGIEADGTPYVRAVGVYEGVEHPYMAADAVPMARRGDWYHLAGVWTRSSGDLQLYVNGELRTVESMPDVPGIFSATGAVSTVVGGSGFVGRIDEVRIWNAGRSALELRDGAYAVLDASEPNLAAYYRFDDGTHAAGTSGTNALTMGQVEDFAIANRNWDLVWTNAATLAGGATVSEVLTPIPAAAFADVDQDELPDFWEATIFGNIEGGLPASDVDSDGLTTLFEYRALMHPARMSTFDDEVEDGLRDPDGDGLLNQEEVVKATLPGVKDTDDDGLTDHEELTAQDDPSTPLSPARRSNPRRSMDPPRPRSLVFDGASRAVVPAEPNHSLAAWTAEAWVRPTAAADGIVLRRATADLPGMRGINYELGVENRGGTLFAYSQYTTDSSGSALQVRLDTTQPGEATTNGILVGSMIAPEEWTHLAATYQPTNYTFKLYVNGDLASYRVDAVGTPALGAGENAAVGSEFTIGGGSLLAGVVQNGFEGHIDEVRIMRGALSDATILEHASGFGEFYGLVQAVDNSGTAAIQTLPPVVATGYNHVAGEMLVRFKTGVSAAIQSNLVTTLGLETMRKNKVVPVSRLRIKDGTALKDKLVEVQANPNVLYAEPNYVRSVSALPDDPLIEQLWAMHNTGQNGGTDDADIDALEAWDRVTGSEQVVVAVIDTGVNYNHTDLADNMWINVGETAGNGVDDDGNGFVDDVYGYDFINSDADPIDDHDHGSHCAGTIGGVGNNGTGVVGVNWTVRIMALKAFSAQGGGSSADIVAAIDYAVLMGAHVSNNSYGGSGFSQAEYDAVEAARNAGHLFVAAAGNDGTDNDTIPQYPASFDLDNIIAVAATDRNDGIAGFSCFGLESVDLGAPGVDIHSTLSGGGYGNMSGTSMATPHTTGAAALIMAANGQLTYDQVRQLIFNGVDLIPSMDGKVATAGRLNLFNSLPEGGGGGGGGPTGPLDIVAYFTFNDAGVHAEDFTVAADYLRGWHRAARLEGAMFDADEFFDNLIDSDGDALPDWWEIGMGLDPYDASGDNGTWADPDMDGLHNYAEFMVASRHRPIVSDPLAWDSDTDGFADFFEWDGLMYRIFGEIYTDFDSMEDAWEVANGLDPLHYDAHRDLDDDGWSNFGEFMAQADPGNASEYPVPSLRFNFRYDGVVAGLPTIMAYSSASMDGVPDAVFDPTALPTVPVEDELFGISGAPAYNVNLDNENLVPGSLVIQDVTHSFVDDGQGALLGTLAGSAGTVDYASGSVELTYETPATPGNIMTASYEYYETVPSYPGTIIYQNATDGYVREGDNWFFAFIDQNSDGDWQDGEPSGTAIGHPIRVDWNSGGPIDIAMTDDMPGYGRFAWTAEPDATEYTVRVSLSGWPPLISPDTVIKAPRTWFHEQDFRNAGVNGLVAGTYQWEVYSTIDGAVLPVEVGTFLVENASVMSVPEPVWPVGQHWLHAQNELRWRMDSDATEFRVQIARDINFTDILFTSPREIAPAPQEGLDGTPGTNTVTTRYTLPIYAGDGDFTNGVYYWHVQSFNADNSTSYSDPGSMTVDLTGSAVGSFSISGDVVYFGKVTNGSFVVQAFSSPGFGGVPMGQVTLPNTSDVPGWPRNAIPFKLAGLRQGSYHVRAFLDQDGDSEKDAWESSGFVQITAYSPEMMTLPVSVANRWLPLWLADTDQDHIADDWEFQYTGDLLTMGPGPVRGYTDQTPGGLNDYETYAAMPMNDSPFDADAAGPDGIPFWVKLAFDIDIYSYYAFAITTVGTDPSDYAVVRWPAPLGTSVQTQNNGTAVMSNNGVTLSYRLQYSSDLITWADLTGSAPVTYDPVAGEFEVVDQFHTGRVGFYRVLLSATQ